MSIAIVDYGVGNIKSIQHCLNRFGLSHEYTSDYNKILNSEKTEQEIVSKKEQK